MQHHVLTEEESANYHDDTVRSEIRSGLAQRYPEGVLVVSSNHELFDTLGPSSESVELAAVVSDEEIDSREQAKLLEEQEIAHLEQDIKPKVILKITSDVKREFRDQLRERTNEILVLKAQNSKIRNESVSALKAVKSELEDVKLELTSVHEQYARSLSELNASREAYAKLEETVTSPGEATASGASR